MLQVPYAVELLYYILGDMAFTLNEYTLKPFEGNPDRGSFERVFNYKRKFTQNFWALKLISF
jgi:hypothetical protein